MAASTSTAAHSNNNSCYDVFISHRGPDVKKTFASHMYHRLIAYGLRVFLDYQELQEGAEFPCQIKGAIRTASVQIAIFSPTYADSQWCLDELVLMLETRAHIFPVFYHVKPTELRRTQGEGVYATSLRNLEKKRKYGSEPRYDSKTIENWRNALSRVADISGFDLDEGFNGDEGKLLDQLVKAVLEKGIRRLNVARYPTGLKEKVEDFETKLSLQGFVGITGLGGVGKTTLAKELFNKKSSTYSKSCFLSDVRERAKSSIPSLQRKLLKDLGASVEAIDSKDEGLEILRKHFSVLSAPVLLVLDDVDHQNQVHALLPVTDNGMLPLPPSSLILITARDKNVLTRSGVQEPSIYNLTGLNTERSRELFCSHAFSQPHPMPGFEDLVNQFLKACNGLPLSLKVVGGHLYGNTNQSYWENELKELRKALPDEIQKSLQISYDALPREERQIFLDIACFFIGESRDTAIRVWDASGWNGSRGFENLLSKCLVELDIVDNSFHMYERPMKYCIRMHDHLRDMGRYLANNTPEFPWRLWRGTKHIEDLLQQSSEATKVRGIRMLRSERYYDERADSDSDVDNERASFSRYKMKNLQLLDIDMEEDHLKCLLDGMDSPNLLWFRWRNCRRSSLPPYIPMKKLWVLEVEGEYNLEMETLWQEDLQTPFRLRELRIRVDVLHKIPKSIGQLKHLELMVVYTRAVYIRADDTVEIPKEFCDLRSLKHLVLRIPQLRSLPDSFGNLSRLEHINLSYCNALERLPDSFGHLSKLEHINLKSCGALERLPDSFGDLSSLQHIDLSCCGALVRLPDSFGHLSKLEHINLERCGALERLPDSFGDLSILQHIDLSCCGALKRLPDSFGHLSKLEHINLKSCGALERLPDSFGDLSILQHIDLSCCGALKRLPDSFGHLSKLEHINLKSCGALERLPDSFGDLSSLQHIDLSCCGALKRLPYSFGDLSSLQHIDLSFDLLFCSALDRLPDSFGHLSKLEHINLSCCGALKRLPDSFGDLSSLQHIDLSYCRSLKRLPDSFGNLSRLQHIDLSYCDALERLPDSFGGLSKLEHINLKCCGALERLPDSFGDLSRLEHIDLYYCFALERLPDSFGHLSNLEHINLRSCRALERLPGCFGNLSKLEHINLSDCDALERLPDSFGNLIKLRYINLLGCRKLTIPGGTFRKITLDEDTGFPYWRIEVSPPEIAHQRYRKKLLLCLINMEELPSASGESHHLEKLVLETPFLEALPPCFGRDLRNLKHLELLSCRSLKRLPDSFLLMDQLIKLIVEDCPLQELHFETVEGGSETVTDSEGQGTLSNLKRGQLRLQHLVLHKTQISEISFPTGVCNNLQYLDIRNCQVLVEVGTLPNALIKLQLIDCPKLRKIERLSGFAKLKTLGVSRCKEVDELPCIKDKSVALAESTGPRELNNSDFSFDNCLLHLQHLELHNTAISEVLYPTGICPNLQYLDIKDCQDLVEKTAVDWLSRTDWLSRIEKTRLVNCSKLRKIEELSGLAKLRVLSIAWCEGVEELSSIETLGSLENLQVVRCSKLKSIRVLAKLTKLRELDVSNCSELEDLPGVEHLRSLEKLWACGCKKLKSIRGSAQLTQLRELDVSECSELEELLHIEHLRSLDKLRAFNCARLKHLQGLAQLTQLRELDVSGCSRLEEMPGVGYLQSLVWLQASECVKLQSIQGLEQMAQLRELEVSYWFELKELLGVEHLKSLLKLQARSCRKLKNIQGLAQLTQLRELDVSFCSELKEMPGVGYLQSLVVLRGSECVTLKSLWGLPRLTHLLELDVSGCCEPEEMQGVGYLSSLMVLRACECVKLKSIQGLEQLTQLLKLDVSGCSELEELRGVGHLISLNVLRTSGCVKLKSIQVLEQLTQLLELHVCNCFELEELLGIEHLKSLKELLATNCKKLKSIQGLEQVTQLKYLDVSGCYELEKMPDVGCLESVVVLRASECVKLKSIQGLEQMTQLRELDVSYCFELEELPGFERLKSLMKLQARCCTKLRRIKGLAQLAQLRELDVSLCPELEERPDVECLQ